MPELPHPLPINVYKKKKKKKRGDTDYSFKNRLPKVGVILLPVSSIR